MMIVLDWLTEVANQFRRWVFRNGDNPLFWAGLFLLGLIIFGLVYNTLNKHRQ